MNPDLHFVAAALREQGSAKKASVLLDVPRTTLGRWIKRYPELQRALTAGRPRMRAQRPLSPRCPRTTPKTDLPCGRPVGHSGGCNALPNHYYCRRCNLQLMSWVSAHKCPHGWLCRDRAKKFKAGFLPECTACRDKKTSPAAPPRRRG